MSFPVMNSADIAAAGGAMAQLAGGTLKRPTVASDRSALYFDTDMGKPIFWNGSDWADATGALAYDTDAIALFARYTGVISLDYQARISVAISKMKASGAWAKLSAFYVMASAPNAVDALLNWKAESFNLTNSGATWAQASGYTTGASKYLDTGVNLSTNLTQNDLSLGYWTGSDGQGSASAMGAYDGSDGTTLNGRDAQNRIIFRVNQGSTASSTDEDGIYHPGLVAADRSDASTTTAYANGVAIPVTTSPNQSSVTPNNLTVKIGTANLSTFATLQFLTAFVGQSMTAAQHRSVYEAMKVVLNPIYMEMDSTYSWWNYNIAVQRDGWTYVVGKRARNSEQILYRINNETKIADTPFVVSSDYDADDHSAGAVGFLPDGRLIAAYCGHNEGSSLRVRISADADPANLGSPVNTPTIDGGPSYPQIHTHEDKLFLTFRTAAALPNVKWDLVESGDHGQKWTRRKRLTNAVSSMGSGLQELYIRPSDIGDGIARFFVVPHPTNEQNAIKLFDWNMATGNVSAGGVVLGNVTDGDNDTGITDYSTLPAIRTPAVGRSNRLLDVADDGTAFLIVDYVTADASDAKYYLVRLTGPNAYDGASWSEYFIANAGQPFWNSSRYFAGMTLAREPHSGLRIYGVEEASGTWTLKRYESANGGASWTTTTLVSASDAKVMRPVSPIGASADLPVIWQRGAYIDYGNFDVATRWAS